MDFLSNLFKKEKNSIKSSPKRSTSYEKVNDSELAKLYKDLKELHMAKSKSMMKDSQKTLAKSKDSQKTLAKSKSKSKSKSKKTSQDKRFSELKTEMEKLIKF